MSELHLEQIKVENYKSLVNTTLKLNSELTALIGINGSGKTNTLSAIKLLRQLTGSHVRRAKYGSDKTNFVKTELIAFFSKETKTFQLKAEMYFDNFEKEDSLKYFDLSLKKNESKSKWVKIHNEAFDFAEYLLKVDKTRHINYMDREYLPEDSELREFVFDLSVYLNKIRYYGATVFSDPSKSPISFELDEEDRISPRNYNSTGHQRFLYDLYVLKSNDKKAFKRYLNAVNELGVNLVNHIDFSQIKVPNSSVKILAGGQTKKITNNRTFVVPVFTVGQLQLSPNQLSEGTFKTLALIFYILNEKSKLMLIEEPEVCVHHGLLASIVELMKQKSREKQIVISTHSDYVLDRLKPENIVLVKKVASGTQTQPLDEALAKDDFRALKTYLEESGNLGEYWKEDGFSFE